MRVCIPSLRISGMPCTCPCPIAHRGLDGEYREGGEEAIKDTHFKEAYKHHDDKAEGERNAA